MDESQGMVIRHEDMELRAPVLIAAFRGWNDAGEAATSAAKHLVKAWGGTKIASIDPEEFFDFQAVRPTIKLVAGETRKIRWPRNEVYGVRFANSEADALIMVGTEPSGRWRTFSGLIIDLARSYNVRLVITLGALLTDVPHSRPVPVTGTSLDTGLVDQLGLERSRYEGPTGIVGVLHDAFTRAGIPPASLWAAVPHYIAISPNPKAALALVERTIQLIQKNVDLDPLRDATQAYDQRVADIVSTDDDVRAYVQMLEERSDQASALGSDLPSGEALAAELEQFLRGREDG